MRPEHLIGYGTDDHRIVRRASLARSGTKPLVLGGVTVSRRHSPIAHSDGDVVYHAIANALLLAAGEGDIGSRFPDTDPRWSGVPSYRFVIEALGIVSRRGYAVNNISVMITAGEPRLSPYVERMRARIADLLCIEKRRVGVGVTSGERLSAHALGKGINATAAVLLRDTR